MTSLLPVAARLPSALPTSAPFWQERGACLDEDGELFFHPEGERGLVRRRREEAAKAVCGRCPVAARCLAHALAVREPYGVWGGLTEAERDALTSSPAPPRARAKTG